MSWGKNEFEEAIEEVVSEILIVAIYWFPIGSEILFSGGWYGRLWTQEWKRLVKIIEQRVDFQSK